jgi:hypothetical protein
MKTIATVLAFFVIVDTAFAQVTWHPISSNTNRELRTIQFVNNDIGYIGGDSTLLKTTDGGASWSSVEIDSIPINSWQQLDIFDMHWFNADHGMIMSGVWSGAFETFDGGTSWSALSFAHNGFCQTTSFFFLDENTGFAGGAGCFEGHIIDRFSNGTWSETTDPENWDSQGWVSALEFKDAQFGLAGTANGILLRTTDGGFNWDTVPNIAGDSAITDFIFHDDGSIRATHRDNVGFGIMISTDNGLTWEADVETATFLYPQMNAAHIDANGTTFMGGVESNTNTGGVIFDNRDGFWNWGMIGEPVNGIASHSDTITFLVGKNGSIHVSVDPVILGLSHLPKTVRFQLSPNPAQLEIRLSSINETIDQIQILDLAGRTVFSQTKPSQPASIDVSTLTTGAYILSIQTDKGMGTQRFIKE